MKKQVAGRAARSRRIGRFAAGLLLAVTAVAARAEFTLEDVHFWVGDGTNRAAVVIDWNVEGASPLVWGYRWNGEPVPARVAIEAIAREDNRLVYASSATQWGTSVDGLGYDRSDVAAAFDLAAGTSTDPDALVGVYAGTLYWAQSPGTGDSFEGCQWSWGGGVDLDLLSDGSWYALKLVDWSTNESTEPTGPVFAAESPYAWRVAAADVKPYTGFDGIVSDPTVALGAPARTVSGYGNIPSHPATPGENAWETDRIVKLVSEKGNTGGSITLEFDHPVVDDPRNPFNLDFIVFSYRFLTISGGYYSTSDPAPVSPTLDAMYAPTACVEVSANGNEWVSAGSGLSHENAFAPTLGYRYDPDHPDESLFEGNSWWGEATDATRPVDPAFSLEGCRGLSLAEICRFYDGSAGGTGFDISELDLPCDEQGRKWFRFVRIVSDRPGDEIALDAVSDVAPAVSFRNWVDANYPFEERPDVAKTTLCANGAPAYANAAFGLAPDEEWPAAAWGVGSFDPATRTLAAPFAPYATDLVFLQSVTSLAAGEWPDSLPLWVGTDDLVRPLLQVQDSADGRAFFRLKVHD